jgi:hypothetical protein
MKLFRRVTRYFRISREERKLFLRALYLLFIWKLKIVFLPMPFYVKFLGHKGLEENAADAELETLISKIQSAMRRADSALPWKSKCLAEAIATKRMLDGKGITSTLYLGVAKDEEEKLIAHAWLRWGQKIIAGELGFEKFTVLQKFS